MFGGDMGKYEDTLELLEKRSKKEIFGSWKCVYHPARI
jgi:hypothetical protein